MTGTSKPRPARSSPSQTKRATTKGPGGKAGGGKSRKSPPRKPRAARRTRSTKPAHPFIGRLADRPLLLASVAAAMLVAGVVLGLYLGDVPLESGPAPVRQALQAETPEPPPKRPQPPVETPSQARTPYEVDYGPAFVAPQPLPVPDVAPPQALAGVRPTDPPVTLREPPVRLAPLPETTQPPQAEPAVPQPAAPQTPKVQPAHRPVAPPPPVATGTRPMIAIVIDDMGIDVKRSRKVVDLPGPITTSWLTYAHDLTAQAARATAAGHQLLLHVPMQPSSATIDPGPDVLTVDMTPEQVRTILDDVLVRLDGIVGINNHMGSRFTEHAPGMHEVMAELKERGLFWLDSKTTAKSVGAREAQAAGVPFAERNVFLDHEETAAFVHKQLAQVEDVARRHGYAIAIGHPKDVTIDGLKTWLPTLQAKGFDLVPVSRIVRLRQGAG